MNIESPHPTRDERDDKPRRGRRRLPINLIRVLLLIARQILEDL